MIGWWQNEQNHWKYPPSLFGTLMLGQTECDIPLQQTLKATTLVVVSYLCTAEKESLICKNNLHVMSFLCSQTASLLLMAIL